MEEENVQVNNGANNNFNKPSFDFKKYLPIAAIVLAVIVVIAILSSVLGGGPKKAVKKYISGVSKGNVKKMYSVMDPIGTAAWSYTYDVDDFDDDDYEEFIENYEEYEEEMKEELEEYEEELEETIEELEESYDEFMDEYKSYKVKVEDFKEVEKIGKDLYVVKAKVSTYAKPKDKEDDEIDESETMTFVVYKNKIISGAGMF